MRTFQIYVKPTSNCDGMPLQTMTELSPTWTGESLILPFGEDGDKRKVVGWTDLYGGTACGVNVTKVRWNGQVGWLVHGGNAGVRILDNDAPVMPGVDDHLPRGYGRPIVWVDDAADLPVEVRKVCK